MNTDGSHHHKEEYVGPEIESAKLHPSGYGRILRDHNGKWIRGFKGYIGVTENQTAELYGIHKGLELLDKLGYKGAILETDCKGAHEYVTRRDDDRAVADRGHGHSASWIHMPLLLSVAAGLSTNSLGTIIRCSTSEYPPIRIKLDPTKLLYQQVGAIRGT
ncbi:polynucleotidyl transferase, ribonuclease H-like superfamily protein 1 [Tanacetum coccineum]